MLSLSSVDVHTLVQIIFLLLALFATSRCRVQLITNAAEESTALLALPTRGGLRLLSGLGLLVTTSNGLLNEVHIVIG